MAFKNIYRLCVQSKKSVYAIAILGYMSDGSYFVRDLSQQEGVYNILKIRINSREMQRFGTFYIPLERTKQWITTHKPKLTHHISGEVHISGTGIISGNFKSVKKPKGVQVLGPHATDGGPMAVFTFWGLEDFQKVDGEPKVNDIVFSANEITNQHPKLYDDDVTDSYTFELFYMDKRIKEVANKHGCVRMRHPHFGFVTLKILNHNTDNPAFFAVMCRKSKVGWNSQHGVVYGSGTTALGKDGFFEQIQVIYPFEDDFKEFLEGGKKTKIRNLDFNPWFKMWCLADDFLNRICN